MLTISLKVSRLNAAVPRQDGLQASQLCIPSSSPWPCKRHQSIEPAALPQRTRNIPAMQIFADPDPVRFEPEHRE
jgi:hypothetical protein